MLKDGVERTGPSLRYLPAEFELAAVRRDEGAMARILEAATGTTIEPQVRLMQGHVLASRGRLREARAVYRVATTMPTRAGFNELAGTILGLQAIWEAEFGLKDDARASATSALALSGGPIVHHTAGIVLARLGHSRAIESAASLERRYPEAQGINAIGPVVIRALVDIELGRISEAIENLEPVVQPKLPGPGVAAVYTQGRALLKKGDAGAAAAVFTRMNEPPRFDVTFPLYAHAWLGLGRARVMMGDTAGAREAYGEFLRRFKDADPNLPVLRDAKAEFAALPPS